MPKTFDEAILNHLEEWRVENHDERWDKDTVAQWMIDKGHWTQPKASPRRELAKLIVKAAKKKRVRNAQGKRVRVWHAAAFEFSGPDGPVQRTLWDSRDSMAADFAQVSFQQRWEQAAGICRSLHDDVDDFNSNNPNAIGHNIQMEFDFNMVVEQPAKQRVEELSPSTADGAASVIVNKERRERRDRQPR